MKSGVVVSPVGKGFCAQPMTAQSGGGNGVGPCSPLKILKFVTLFSYGFFIANQEKLCYNEIIEADGLTKRYTFFVKNIHFFKICIVP